VQFLWAVKRNATMPELLCPSVPASATFIKRYGRSIMYNKLPISKPGTVLALLSYGSLTSVLPSYLLLICLLEIFPRRQSSWVQSELQLDANKTWLAIFRYRRGGNSTQFLNTKSEYAEPTFCRSWLDVELWEWINTSFSINKTCLLIGELSSPPGPAT